jgi:hypothetical protein
VLPLLRNVRIGEDRFDRAGGNACAAIDANLGINVELRIAFVSVDTVDRANVDARFVFGSDARFGNDIRHGYPIMRHFKKSACKVDALVAKWTDVPLSE